MTLSFNSRDWSLVATTIKNLSREKIVDLGRRFTSPYLIVRVASREQKDTWYYGGKIWATNLVLGKQAKFYQVDLDLFEQELLIVPKYFDGKYSLLYEAPKYFPDVILKIWEYTGEIRDSVIEQSQNYLELNSQINAIAQQISVISNSISSENLSVKAILPDNQLQQINNSTIETVDRAITRLNTLSNNLGKVLNNEADPSILQTSDNLIYEFV